MKKSAFDRIRDSVYATRLMDKYGIISNRRKRWRVFKWCVSHNKEWLLKIYCFFIKK